MSFILKKPCGNCPFLAKHNFHLGKERAAEIANGLLNELEFDCHKTIEHDDETGEGIPTHNSKLCAGAFALCWKHDRRTTIAQRFALSAKLITPAELEAMWPNLYESFEHFIEANSR